MDRHSGNNASQSQSTNHSSTINNPSLPLDSGQQASILQVGGQSFLILTSGQPSSPLQGLGLNLVPVGGPDASLLQTGGPQEQLQVRCVQPAFSQVGGSKPLFNQTGRVQPNIVQMRGPRPATIQLGPGVQPQTVQANELRFKPSQSISPLDTRVQVGEQRSSSVQGGHTVPPRSSTLQIRAPKFTSKSLVEDRVQSVITQTGGAMPLLTQTSRAQPRTVQIGGHVTSSVQVGSTTPLGMAKAKTSKIKIQTMTEKTFHPGLVQNSGTMPPSSQTGRFQPRIAQFGRLQSSSAQVTSAVPIQTEFSQAHATFKTEPGLEEPAEIKILTIQASGRYAETANVINFSTPTIQPSLFQPSLGHAGRLHTLAPQENAKISALTKKNKHSLTKKGSKCQQDTPKYTDAACSAYNLVKMKHACTNTTKMSKSIGTQAKIALKSKSQAIQFPENSLGEPKVPTYQECSTQSEEFFWPGEDGFRQSREFYTYKVDIVRDPEPENVSVFFSGASLKDSDEAWNMEGAEKWIHKSYEAEHPHFDDIAVYFTEEEWACLNDKERNLYKKVMMDNYWNLVAVGKVSVTPPLISKIERGEELCIRSLQQADHKQFPDLDSRDDPSSQNIFSECYNIQRFYERLKIITTPIRLAMAGLTVTRIMSDPSSCEPSQAAQGEHRIRDPGDQCPFKPFLKEKPVINVRPFRCFKCERTFKRFGNLSSHYQRVHQSDNDLTCSECGKKFSNMKALLLHFMRHTGERPFVCMGCGKTFASQVCLNNHYGLNSKKKQYECLECGKQFSLKQSLIKHEKLHQMDNHNVCLVCGKEFAHKSGLRLHERMHGSHYVCSQCGRYFSCKEDCDKHMVDHGQMQLFVCTECGNAFLHESQLIEHQKLHQANYANLVYPDLVIKVKEED
ncbi:hypothetical protein AB205_0216340 [Aquarana catesbeiana]|uniref:Uncharacterized protein n=1 Tax=Aquarana catesbeiana TaxID=8400 RepID=A0A2G9RAS5_AQUCT|nr:hypothetical protein AB205_0216340 [Aquarana catesbeiana]